LTIQVWICVTTQFHVPTVWRRQNFRALTNFLTIWDELANKDAI